MLSDSEDPATLDFCNRIISWNNADWSLIDLTFVPPVDWLPAGSTKRVGNRLERALSAVTLAGVFAFYFVSGATEAA